MTDTRRGRCNIFLSAAGRRVALLNILRDAQQALGLTGKVVGTDVSAVSAAYQLAEVRHLVPRYSDPDCFRAILEVCRRCDIQVIVPTIDPDLPFYARHLKTFQEAGIQPAVSSPAVIDIGYDKVSTHAWLVDNGLPTVEQFSGDRLDSQALRFPVFAKPTRGSSSIGAQVVQSVRQLEAIDGLDGYVVQSLATGREYTVDVYVNRQGKCLCAVPRLRLETRAGEVSKGMTVRHPKVQQIAHRVAEALPGAWGVLNVQIFHNDHTDDTRVIEINPRFGGGFPLTHAAGAPMARWLLEEVMDLPCTAAEGQWRDGVVMLRYDEAVYVDCQQAGLDRAGQRLQTTPQDRARS